MPQAGPNQQSLLEIQVHSSQIKRGVHYLFVTRRQLFVGVGVASLYLAFLVFNLVIAPRVLSGLMHRSEYREFVAERSRHGERLGELNSTLSELRDRTEQLHLTMGRIYMAYGLESDISAGQGGYPLEPPPVPDSIYARQIRNGSQVRTEIEERLQVLETFIGEVRSFEEAHGDQVTTTPSLCPLRAGEFVLTSPYGTRRSPFTKQLDFHPGLDLAAPEGTPIHAPADGVVVFAGRYSLKESVGWWRYGNLVALRNGDRYITLYGHCDEVLVRSGQEVKQGDVLATVGNTGWSTNPHLHYEVRARGEDDEFHPIDPRIYILDYRWRDEESLLIMARRAPNHQGFEPLPRLFAN